MKIRTANFTGITIALTLAAITAFSDSEEQKYRSQPSISKPQYVTAKRLYGSAERSPRSSSLGQLQLIRLIIHR